MTTLFARRSALGMAAVLVGSLVSLAAHEKKIAGALELVIGWADEPALAGLRNAVVVTVADRQGPVKEAVGSLSVEIAFGSERMTLPLEPAADRPHEFRAWLVPTRAGTYTFHVTGTLRGQGIDVTSTCADDTFHCVQDSAAIQFPVKDPSTGQLADRIERTLPRAELASETAASAKSLAIAALVVSVLGAAAIVLGRRRGGANG